MKRNYNVTVIEFRAGTNVLRFFESSLALALASMGCKVKYLTRADWKNAVRSGGDPLEYDFIAQCDFFISFNNLDTVYGIFDQLGKPLISVCVDRPYHMKWSFDNKAANVLYLWSDENDLQYAPVYFRGGIHRFLPHAADIYPPPEDGLLFKERDIDVLVSCNFYAKNQSVQMDSYHSFSGNYPSEIIDAITQKYIEGGVCLEDCVKEITNWDEEKLTNFMRTDGMVIDTVTRYEKKYHIMKALVETGVRVDCCGSSWKNSGLTGYPNFICRGYTLYPDFQKILERAKILVNIFPISNVSAHERIFGSMMKGALCVTDPTDWLREHFADGESIVFYDPKDPESLAEKISFYLNNEEERLRVTRSAMAIVLREHTWLNRAEELLNIYEELTGEINEEEL